MTALAQDGAAVLQAPVLRLTVDKAMGMLPPLQRAAAALERIEAEAISAGERESA